MLMLMNDDGDSALDDADADAGDADADDDDDKGGCGAV